MQLSDSKIQKFVIFPEMKPCTLAQDQKIKKNPSRINFLYFRKRKSPPPPPSPPLKKIFFSQKKADLIISGNGKPEKTEFSHVPGKEYLEP